MKRRPGPRPFLVDCAPMMSARTLGAFLERTAALLSLAAGAALIGCATTERDAGGGTMVYGLQYGTLLVGNGCLVRTATDDFTDAVSHLLQCGTIRKIRGGAGDMMVFCTAEQWGAAVEAPAFGAGSVEVTYRFDDQPAVHEQWEYDEGLAVSTGAADPILDGLATADRLVFRVGRGETTEIIGLTDFGADAVAAFLRRCEPPPA